MAPRTITLSVSSPTEGFAWNVYFSVDDATPIRNIPISPSNPSFLITCPTNTSGNFTVPTTGSIRNVMNGFSSHSTTIGGVPTTLADANSDSYVTWRSNTATPGQYPFSGRSMDIWSVGFYNDIMFSGETWAQIGNGATYTLNPRKWSLIYDYSSGTAFVWSKGGTLTVSVV